MPPAFLAAVDALRSARLRPELEVEVTRPPQRLAPHAFALEAAVVDGEDDLADGRLVLLHDPAGHDAWQGAFRLVTLVRAELEPEMAADPLLPEVCWSWLTGALDARGLSYGEAAWDGDTRRIALLRCAVRAPPGDADRDPGLVDAEGVARRCAGHGVAPDGLGRSAVPDRGTAAVRSGGRGGGDVAAAARATGLVTLRHPFRTSTGSLFVQSIARPICPNCYASNRDLPLKEDGSAAEEVNDPSSTVRPRLHPR